MKSILSSVSLTLIAGCLSFNLFAANSVTLTPEQIKQLGIQIGTLQTSTLIPVLTAPAKVLVPPAHEQLISAPQGGLITRLNFAVGDSVKKGVAVAQLNSPEILTLQQQFLSLDNQRQLALSNLERDKKLFSEGVIAKKRWIETHSQYQLLDSEAKAVQQLLSVAGMSAAQIRQLAHTRHFDSVLTVYAPISGIILEKMATTGSI